MDMYFKQKGIFNAEELRNRIAHSTSPLSTAQGIKFSYVAVFLKYLEDNNKPQNILMPEIIKTTNTTMVSNENFIRDLKEYLEDVEQHYGLSSSAKTIYEDLKEFGIEEQVDSFIQIQKSLHDYDFSGYMGQQLAIGMEIQLLRFLSENSAQHVRTMPIGILKLLDNISNIQDGVSCYGVTSDSASTLAYLTTGNKCNIVAESVHDFTAIDNILWIIAADNKNVIRTHNNIEWFPTSMGNSTYDRVYAFPPYENVSIKSVEIYSKDNGQDYIEGWPEKLNCGMWIYARRMVKALSVQGYGYLLLPLGQLSRMGDYADVRSRLIENDLIDAVIEFPGELFHPDADVKTALIILKKWNRSHKVRMINLNSTAATKYWAKDYYGEYHIDLRTVIPLFTSDKKGVSEEITIQEISKNNWSLNPSGYVSPAYDFKKEGKGMDSLMSIEKDLQQRIYKSEQKYDGAIELFVKLMEKWEEDHE